jgi:hypothetical protein
MWRRPVRPLQCSSPGEPLTKTVASRQGLPARWEVKRNSHELSHASCIDLTLFLRTVHGLDGYQRDICVAR